MYGCMYNVRNYFVCNIEEKVGIGSAGGVKPEAPA